MIGQNKGDIILEIALVALYFKVQTQTNIHSIVFIVFLTSPAR